jgi:hypothetical protein
MTPAEASPQPPSTTIPPIASAREGARFFARQRAVNEAKLEEMADRLTIPLGAFPYNPREGTLFAAVSLERVPASGAGNDRRHVLELFGAGDERRWFFREDGPALKNIDRPPLRITDLTEQIILRTACHKQIFI